MDVGINQSRISLSPIYHRRQSMINNSAYVSKFKCMASIVFIIVLEYRYIFDPCQAGFIYHDEIFPFEYQVIHFFGSLIYVCNLSREKRYAYCTNISGSLVLFFSIAFS